MSAAGRAKVVLAALALAGACWFGLQGIYGYSHTQRARLAEQEREAVHATYGTHETIALDTERDAVELSDGEVYESSFPWTGELDVTVEGASWYQTGDLLLQRLNTDEEWAHRLKRGWFDRVDSSYLVVRIVIENVSATPEAMTHHGDRWFNISFVHLVYDGVDSELAGFSGVPDEAAWDLGEGSYFSLPIGQRAYYDLVFEVNPSTDPAPSPYLYLGVAYVPDRYRIVLDDVQAYGVDNEQAS